MISKIFHENLDFQVLPKVNSINENYKKNGGNVKVTNKFTPTYPNYFTLLKCIPIKIFDEKTSFESKPKIDSRNDAYQKPVGSFKVHFYIQQ